MRSLPRIGVGVESRSAIYSRMVQSMNRSVKLGLFIILGIIIYAYGFSVTQVNLEELGMPARQEALTRILRALAHPDFFEFDQVEVEVETPIYVPCPADGTRKRRRSIRAAPI